VKNGSIQGTLEINSTYFQLVCGVPTALWRLCAARRFAYWLVADAA